MKKVDEKRYERIRPLLFVFAMAMVSYLGYYNAHLIQVDWLFQLLAALSGGIYFACIFFGSFYVYIATSLNGVPLPGRVLASCLLPFAWMTKDVLTLLESHPLLECLYWYFNPLSIWMVSLLMVEMSAGTLLIRFIRRRRGENGKVFTPGPILIGLLGLVTFAGVYAWGQGENLFAIYLHVYRFLFGSGV
jgi:hypothetical protein